MRLGDLKNIMCCDVKLVFYTPNEIGGNPVYLGHIFNMPDEFNECIVMNITPYGDSLILLLEAQDEKDRNK